MLCSAVQSLPPTDCSDRTCHVGPHAACRDSSVSLTSVAMTGKVPGSGGGRSYDKQMRTDQTRSRTSTRTTIPRRRASPQGQQGVRSQFTLIQAADLRQRRLPGSFCAGHRLHWYCAAACAVEPTHARHGLSSALHSQDMTARLFHVSPSGIRVRSCHCSCSRRGVTL